MLIGFEGFPPSLRSRRGFGATGSKLPPSPGTGCKGAWVMSYPGQDAYCADSCPSGYERVYDNDDGTKYCFAPAHQNKPATKPTATASSGGSRAVGGLILLGVIAAVAYAATR